MGKKDPNKPGVVYVVTDKREPYKVRYVGRTVQGMELRAYKHWSDCKRGRAAFPKWLQSRLDRKEDVVFTEVSWHPNVAELNKAEVATIARYRAIGQADLNMTDGGDGSSPGPWSEERATNHRKAVPRGETHVWSKLTWEDVKTLRELVCREGVSSVNLAREYGVSVAAMSEMLRNETWYDPNYDPSERKMLPMQGETARNARLTQAQVDEIRKHRQETYETHATTGRRYGVSKDMIRLIVLNKNWYDPNYDPETAKKKGEG